MNDESLRAFLKDVDSAAPPRPIAGDMADRVRRSIRRRRHLRFVAAAILVAATGVSVFQFAGRQRPLARVTDQATEAESLREQYAQLAVDAKNQEQLVETVLCFRRQARLQHRREQMQIGLGSIQQIATAREEAAAVLMASGDGLLTRPGGEPAAVERYRDAAELFPETLVAPAVLERLKRLST